MRLQGSAGRKEAAAAKRAAKAAKRARASHGGPYSVLEVDLTDPDRRRLPLRRPDADGRKGPRYR